MGRDFRQWMRFRKIWQGSWWWLGELCEVPRCLLWRWLRCYCPVYNFSCIFFSKCLYFSYCMARYFLDRPCIVVFRGKVRRKMRLEHFVLPYIFEICYLSLFLLIKTESLCTNFKLLMCFVEMFITMLVISDYLSLNLSHTTAVNSFTPISLTSTKRTH